MHRNDSRRIDGSSESRRIVRRLLAATVVAVAAAGLTLVPAVASGPRPGSGSPEYGSSGPGPAAVPVAAGSFGEIPAGTLDQHINQLQRHLRGQPKDARGWASLGLAYVERARVSADPGYYPKAEGVLNRSLRVQPQNNDAARGGQAALAAARHDFAVALRRADQALAINPYGARALAVRVDALVELGRYPEAYRAARRADQLKPGIPAFTRLAYVLELRGEAARARTVLEHARDSATEPGDVAYVATQLAELAWNRGDREAASGHLADALRADPSYVPARDGRARLRAADGDTAGAVRDLTAIVRQLPLPSYAVSLGETFEVRGQRDKAREQYAVAHTWAALAGASGVGTDLEVALFEADHGDRAAALRAARAEWNRRHSLPVADALAWALHVNGRDAQALDYARQAARTGYRNALFRYHRGMIEKSLGQSEAARRSLTQALDQGPGLSPLQAARARAALAKLREQP